MQDNNSKWEFDSPKFWDLTGLLKKKLPSDAWFRPSFPAINQLKKKRLVRPELSQSSTFKAQSSAKRQKTNNDVFSRLSATTTVSSAFKTNNPKVTKDSRLNRHTAVHTAAHTTQKTAPTRNTLRDPQRDSTVAEISKHLDEAEPKKAQTTDVGSKRQSFVFSSKNIPQTPPEQIRSLSYELDSPPPPSPEKTKKDTNFKLLHRQHMRIVNDLRDKIRRSIAEVKQ